MNPPSVTGTLVDLHAQRTVPARVSWEAGRIVAVEEISAAEPQFIMPGFIDAHVHIESSMLAPGEFARQAVVHGTVATVSDPHEIANVLGTEGVEFMLADARQTPLKICFGAPSCVPATSFETAGACLDARQVACLLNDDRIGYLSEMMNYPGVLRGDPEVLAKLAAARNMGKPQDGHAPGLRGEDARRYFASGISTDHECSSKPEALEKLAAGALIQIRQGSAARNLDALWTLIDEYPNRVMLCTDDLHPDDFVVGHMDRIVRDCVTRGANLFHVLRAACVNPVAHYRLPVGLLRPGDPADFIVVQDLHTFQVRQTVIAGTVVARDGVSLFPVTAPVPVNRFAARPKSTSDFHVAATTSTIRVMVAIDGELVTREQIVPCRVTDGMAVSAPDQDVLKIAVSCRYLDRSPAVAFIRGFGLRQGAIASSVAHDCHNVVSVGVSDEAICAATNAVIEMGGGLAVVDGSVSETLPLPVAGLMSRGPCAEVAQRYAQLTRMAHTMGSSLRAPFMTLSFMALLVIPKLKLSDRGLFDGERFEFVSVFI